MDTKKIIGFGILAAAAIFALSSFKSASAASSVNPDPTGHPKAMLDTTTGLWTDTATATFYNATSKAWESIASDSYSNAAAAASAATNTNNASGSGASATNQTAATWQNASVITFTSPFSVTYTTQVRTTHLVTINETAIVKGYSVTQNAYLTDSATIPADKLAGKIPTWFVPWSSNLQTLVTQGKIKNIVFVTGYSLNGVCGRRDSM